MGVVLQQIQTVSQNVLNAIEVDRNANKSTTCAELKSDIRNAALIADAMVTTMTLGRLSAVAEQPMKPEKLLES